MGGGCIGWLAIFLENWNNRVAILAQQGSISRYNTKVIKAFCRIATIIVALNHSPLKSANKPVVRR